MRIFVSVLAVVAVTAGTLSVVLWGNWKTEQQLVAGLRAELADARAELAARPVAIPAPAVPAPAVEAPPAAPAMAPPERAAAVLVEQAAKRQQSLIADPEYRKARLEQARVGLRRVYAGFAEKYGLSQQQMDRVIDIEAEFQVRASEQGLELVADGGPTDAAAMAELQRKADEFQGQLKAQVAAVIGQDGFEQLEEYELTQPSRTRVTNLTNLLARSGHPLSSSQTESLTRVIIAEQKRVDAENRSYAEAGKSPPKSQAERQVETNHNILEAATGFLDSQQLELVKGRFQERATIDRADERVQQRERAVLQQQSGQ
jgi:hypothetical protein